MSEGKGKKERVDRCSRELHCGLAPEGQTEEDLVCKEKEEYHCDLSSPS